MDFVENLLRVLVALAVVLVVIVVTIPLIFRKTPIGRFYSRQGEKVKVKTVIPLTKGVSLVEIEIEGKTFVLWVGESEAGIIYKDENTDFDPSDR